jgi:hypothetical protein
MRNIALSLFVLWTQCKPGADRLAQIQKEIITAQQ